MKKTLMLALFGLALGHYAGAESFEYEYEGTNFKFDTIDDNTCRLLPSRPYYSGDVIVPEIAVCNGVEYRVVELATDAFEDCHKLSSIKLPNTLEVIGMHAFFDSSITTIDIPQSVKTVGSAIFGECLALESITGKFATPDHRSLICDGVLVGFAPVGITEYQIPRGVEKIGSCAFASCKDLINVTIPNSVKVIGSEAFSGCSSLLAIELPNSVEEVAYQAFSGCRSATVLTLSNSLTTIGASAFTAQITSLTIPSSVVSMGERAFAGCEELTHVKIENKFVGKKCFIGCANLATVEFGDDVREIKESAFEECTGLTSINLPESLVRIGDHAFFRCENLADISMGNKVKSIGWEAFFMCKAIKDFRFPDSVEELSHNIFGGCENLESVTFGSSIKKIPAYTFQVCTNLKNIEIEGEVEYIGESAFYNCNSLKNIAIPQTVTMIREDAFNLSGLYNDENNWDNDVLYIGDCLIKARSTCPTEYTVKEGTRLIANNAFSGCSNLTKVELPNSLSIIGERAFFNCTSLLSINLGSEKLTDVGEFAFYGCTALETIVLGDNITSLPYRIFYGCINLKSVILGAGIEEIGNWAFEECNNIQEIDLGNSVRIIGGGAFLNCKALARVTLGDNVESIGGSAFVGTALYNDSKNWTNDIFYIGKYLIEAKKEIEGSIMIKEGTRLIAKSAFMGCSSLKYVKTPNSVLYIGNDAFEYCTSLAKVDLGSGLKALEFYTFYDCSSLSSIVLPETLESIAFCAFKGCKSLESISIPASVKSIEHYAFQDCTSLNDVKIGNPNAIIGQDAFLYNTALAQNKSLWENGALYINSILIGKEYNENEREYTVKWGTTSLAGGSLPYSLYSVKLPSSLKTISDGAFCLCDNLKELEIPQNVEYIGGLFRSGNSLSELYSRIPDPTAIYTDDDAFNNIETLYATLYVPIGTKELYEQTYPWSEFYDIVEVEYADIEEITLDEFMPERPVDDAYYYDLMGRRVRHPAKGLYIHHGRKVIVK